MKNLIYFIFVFLILTACNKKNQVVISGMVKNGNEKELVFSELLVNGTQEIKKIELDEGGKFSFKTTTEFPRFYKLSVSNNNFITLLAEPGEKIQIQTDASNMNNSVIQGSEGSLLVQKLNNQLLQTRKKLESLSKTAKSLEGTKDFDEKIKAIDDEYVLLVNTLRDSSISVIVSNLNSLACIVALYQKYDDENYVLYKNRDLQYIKIVSESLAKKYPESKHVKALLADKENLFNRYNQVKASKELSKIVNTQDVYKLPEIYLPDQSGDSISLNKVKAKYILLNFWASWSKESTKKNLELLDIYKKYHTKGFEIYQVSLDTKQDNWIKAINFDQLPWINVIDTNGRMSYYARVYNITNLPTSFLINPEKEIIKANPTKKDLLSIFSYALK